MCDNSDFVPNRKTVDITLLPGIEQWQNEFKPSNEQKVTHRGKRRKKCTVHSCMILESKVEYIKNHHMIQIKEILCACCYNILEREEVVILNDKKYAFMTNLSKKHL